MVDYLPLLRDFQKYQAVANALESPNPQDTRHIKIAMVGFAIESDIVHWEYEQYQFVDHRIRTDLSTDDQSSNWIDFACLAMGYLLGLVDKGKILTNADLMTAEAQLPGFMWLHSAEIEG